MRKRILVVAAVVVVLATATVGMSLAQAGSATKSRSRHVIHVVVPARGHVQFFDFNHDGLTLGDRLATVFPILDKSQTERLGTAYGDCWVGAPRLNEGSPYVCSNILKLKRGTITTEGLDPHGLSDVLFSITGGTGAYKDIDGQAEYIDTATQTDIIIRLDD